MLAFIPRPSAHSPRRPPQRVARRRGFTMIELVIAIVLVGIIIAAYSTVTLRNARTAQQESSMRQIVENIRQAQDACITRLNRYCTSAELPETVPPSQMQGFWGAANWTGWNNDAYNPSAYVGVKWTSTPTQYCLALIGPVDVNNLNATYGVPLGGIKCFP